MMWKEVDKRALLTLHNESLALHGGLLSIRDEGLLDSALARPLNLTNYNNPDFAELAASYGLGLAKNHPFVDGNKRAAFIATGLFLFVNGYRLTATQVDATITMLNLAAGEIVESDFTALLREHSSNRS